MRGIIRIMGVTGGARGRTAGRAGGIAALLAGASLIATGAVAATTATVSMRVSAEVPSLPGTCLVQTTATFATDPHAAADPGFTVAVRCSGTVPYKVGFDAGLRLAEGATLVRASGPAGVAIQDTVGGFNCRNQPAGIGHAAAGLQPDTFVCVAVRSTLATPDTDIATISY